MASPADSNSNDPFFLISKHEYARGVLKSSTANLIRADTFKQFMQQELRKTEIPVKCLQAVSPPYSRYQPNASTACPLACTDMGGGTVCGHPALLEHHASCHCHGTKSTFLHGQNPWAQVAACSHKPGHAAHSDTPRVSPVTAGVMA